MEDIGKQKLLLLFFVIQTEFQYSGEDIQLGPLNPLDSLFVGRVDLVPVIIHFSKRGPRHQTPIVARMLLTNGVIVGVKKDLELRMHRLVIRLPSQQERLKKPAGGSQMPLCGTHARCCINRFGTSACLRWARVPA